jgi:hypothetical protein
VRRSHTGGERVIAMGATLLDQPAVSGRASWQAADQPRDRQLGGYTRGCRRMVNHALRSASGAEVSEMGAAETTDALGSPGTSLIAACADVSPHACGRPGALTFTCRARRREGSASVLSASHRVSASVTIANSGSHNACPTGSDICPRLVRCKMESMPAGPECRLCVG